MTLAAQAQQGARASSSTASPRRAHSLAACRAGSTARTRRATRSPSCTRAFATCGDRSRVAQDPRARFRRKVRVDVRRGAQAERAGRFSTRAAVSPTPLDERRDGGRRHEHSRSQNGCSAADSSESLISLEKHELVAKAKVAQSRLCAKRDDVVRGGGRGETEASPPLRPRPKRPAGRARPLGLVRALSARDEAGSVQDEEAPPAEPVRDPGDADQPSQKYCDMSENSRRPRRCLLRGRSPPRSELSEQKSTLKGLRARGGARSVVFLAYRGPQAGRTASPEAGLP